MKYYSTQDHAARYTLKQAAFMGLAPDGGLFMPERIPTVDKDRVLELSEGSFADLAEYIAGFSSVRTCLRSRYAVSWRALTVFRCLFATSGTTSTPWNSFTGLPLPSRTWAQVSWVVRWAN